MSLPLSQPFEASLLAALKLQMEWGVEAVTESIPWQPMDSLCSRTKTQREKNPIVSLSRRGVTEIEVASYPQEEVPVLVEAGDGIESLRSFLDQFRDQPLFRTATHHLVPELHEGARFVIIGEVPDADEDRSGTLFSGEAGFYLEKIMQSLHLKREDINFVPSIPWRPPGGRPLLPGELKIAEHILGYALKLTKDLPVVTMGTTPLRLLAGKATQIVKARENGMICRCRDRMGRIAFYRPIIPCS